MNAPEKTNEELINRVKELEQLIHLLQESQQRENNERKQAEDKLRKSNEQMEATLNELPVMLFELDSNGRICDFRAPRVDLLYLQPEMFMGKTVNEIFPDDVRLVINAALSEAAATGRHKGGCYAMQTPAGLNWYEMAISTKVETYTLQTHFVVIVNEITERKLASDAMKTTLSLLNATLDSTADGLLVVDREGKIVKWNHKFASMWQIPEEFLLCNDDALVIQSIKCQLIDDDQFVDRVNYLYSHPDESSFDRIKFVDGRVFERYSQPQRIGTAIVGRVWSFRDITGRVNAEAESRKLSFAVEQNPSTIVITNVRGEIEYVNPKFTELTGYTNPDAKGKNPRILKSGVTTDELYKNLWNTISSGRVWEGEFCNKKKNGELYWESAKISPIMDESGRITHYVAVKENITKRRQIEESLRKSEAFNKSIVENEPECVKIMAPDGTLTYMNGAGLRMIEADSLDQVVGKSIYHLIAPESREAYIALTENVFKGISGKLIFEIIGLRGTHRWLETSVVPMPDMEGKVESLLGITRDITVIRQAELKIHKQNHELVKVNAEKDKFFSIIAHDLRTPFNGFLGLTEIMAKELPQMTMDEIRELSVILHNSARNLYNLLGNLLEWSLIKRGLVTYYPSKILLATGIPESLTLTFDAAKRKEITVVLDVPDDLTVFADWNMFQTILRNLANNAVKFTPKGGEITISAAPDAYHHVRISVQDNGIGMNKHRIKNLFRLDVNTNRIGTNGESSTGLGLIICKDLIEEHRGQLYIESKPNKGTLFRFTLPAKKI